jgi:hypothetical protein
MDLCVPSAASALRQSATNWSTSNVIFASHAEANTESNPKEYAITRSQEWVSRAISVGRVVIFRFTTTTERIPGRAKRKGRSKYRLVKLTHR